jgi:hypothetical protein
MAHSFTEDRSPPWRQSGAESVRQFPDHISGKGRHDGSGDSQEERAGIAREPCKARKGFWSPTCPLPRERERTGPSGDKKAPLRVMGKVPADAFLPASRRRRVRSVREHYVGHWLLRVPVGCQGANEGKLPIEMVVTADERHHTAVRKPRTHASRRASEPPVSARAVAVIRPVPIIIALYPSFYGRPRTNTRPGQIYRRHSIPDSIPLVPAVKYCPWHQRIWLPCRIHRPYHCFRP